MYIVFITWVLQPCRWIFLHSSISGAWLFENYNPRFRRNHHFVATLILHCQNQWGIDRCEAKQQCDVGRHWLMKVCTCISFLCARYIVFRYYEISYFKLRPYTMWLDISRHSYLFAVSFSIIYFSTVPGIRYNISKKRIVSRMFVRI